VFNDIVNYIIHKVQTDSILSGFQLLINVTDIELRFGLSLDTDSIDCILDLLREKEEVADVVFYNGYFDVLLYTDYALNY